MRLMVAFMRLLVDLAKAEKAGKTDHPDYQDLKLFAEEFPVRIASGERHVFFPKITGPGLDPPPESSRILNLPLSSIAFARS